MAGAGVLWNVIHQSVPHKEIERLYEMLESDYTEVFRMSQTIARLAIKYMGRIEHGDLIVRAADCGHKREMKHHVVREALSLLAKNWAMLSNDVIGVDCGYQCLQEYYGVERKKRGSGCDGCATERGRPRGDRQLRPNDDLHSRSHAYNTADSEGGLPLTMPNSGHF